MLYTGPKLDFVELVANITPETQSDAPYTGSLADSGIFQEHYADSFKGAPGVIINHVPTQKTQSKYNFVTSILIESEQGPNEPTFINTSEELLNIYGDIITNDMKHCLSFLNYSPSLLVQRTYGNESWNASTEDFPLIKITGYEQFRTFPEEDFLLDATVRFIAQTPGKAGNFLKVSLFTTEELRSNSPIYGDYKARDIIQGMDDMCYCVAIFKDTGSSIKLKEVFVVPFNDLESINTQSKYVYVRLNAYNDFLDGLYDGNEHFWSGNRLFADGDVGRYFYGYDGNLQLIDGNVGLYDGNDNNQITYIVKFFNDTIMHLGDGLTERASFLDMEESCEDLDNTLNYDIDLHIANNITLFRKDCVNIVGTPKGIEQALDFKLVFDARRSTYDKEKTKNTMFVYGTKILDKKEINCSGDVAGIRSKEILTNGLGISTSKITKPLSIKSLKTNPSVAEMYFLYQNGINIVHNSRGIVYCNGEILHQENIGTIKDIEPFVETNNIDLTGWESPNDNPGPELDARGNPVQSQ